MSETVQIFNGHMGLADTLVVDRADSPEAARREVGGALTQPCCFALIDASGRTWIAMTTDGLFERWAELEAQLPGPLTLTTVWLGQPGQVMKRLRGWVFVSDPSIGWLDA